MGWSEITPYTFDVYDGWEEIPVSIADPGGSEIYVRFNSETDGGLKVVLAPVLRFADVAVRISHHPTPPPRLAKPVPRGNNNPDFLFHQYDQTRTKRKA